MSRLRAVSIRIKNLTSIFFSTICGHESTIRLLGDLTVSTHLPVCSLTQHPCTDIYIPWITQLVFLTPPVKILSRHSSSLSRFTHSITQQDSPLPLQCLDSLSLP